MLDSRWKNSLLGAISVASAYRRSGIMKLFTALLSGLCAVVAVVESAAYQST